MGETIFVCGGDGFCGWPSSLRLAASGHKVVILDNLVRRSIDNELGSGSLTVIRSIKERVQAANAIGDVNFEQVDLVHEPLRVLQLIQKYKPSTIVHFAEQRAAPYSMIGSQQRRYTVNNNVTGTHNICDAIVESGLDIHLVHLGTMGVYGYSKDFGSIPEGYLNIDITQTGKNTDILYPANPGSIYHMTKCLDQLIFQFYVKNWNLRITDLHQGIVWGVETKETKLDDALVNRFDYDGIYGTVLNRFLTQAVNGENLTVYGTGGQTRAFIHINDTAECIKIACENADFDPIKPRIFNQIAETATVVELAKLVAKHTGADIDYLENPRKELAENELEVSNAGLTSLGYVPTLLQDGLIEDALKIAQETKLSFNPKNVRNSPKW